MKNILLGIVILLTTFAGNAQEHKINGTISDLKNDNVYLMQIMGEKRMVIDTAKTDDTGAFTFYMPENQDIGMYTILKGKGQAIDLIYNNEDIQFTTTGTDPSDDINIISSIENLIYYDYLNIRGMNMYKMDLIRNLVSK